MRNWLDPEVVKMMLYCAALQFSAKRAIHESRLMHSFMKTDLTDTHTVIVGKVKGLAVIVWIVYCDSVTLLAKTMRAVLIFVVYLLLVCGSEGQRGRNRGRRLRQGSSRSSSSVSFQLLFHKFWLTNKNLHSKI